MNQENESTNDEISISKYEESNKMNVFVKIGDKVFVDTDAPAWVINLVWYGFIFACVAFWLAGWIVR